MLIAPALAHGTGGVGTALGPLILLAVAIVFGLAYLARKTWRNRKPRRRINGT